MTLCFFLIALIYSSAGFGGGSMYLALLSWVSPEHGVINKTNGLICNTAVTAQGSWQWTKQYMAVIIEGWPILLISALSCSTTAYFFRNEGVVQWIMSLALILAGLAILIQDHIRPWHAPIHHMVLLFISGLIGILAGLTGIGGGIYLSPILHLGQWKETKSIATLCSMLILVNSTISLFILLFLTGFDYHNIQWSLPVAALIGGFIGSKTGIQWLSLKQIKWITALILVAVGSQFIWTAIR
ncbi:MAG: hypothetical protein RL609_521 [Bacteroidota bacterium]